MIQPERIKKLNQKEPCQGKYVLYWMQASQRAEYNHALEYAVLKANELGKPLVVFFGLTGQYPEANERHYLFMLQGLLETQNRLQERGILMVIRQDSPDKGAEILAQGACLVVADRGYTRLQRAWRQNVANNISCPLVQVESDVVVPIEAVSKKEEYAAATIRKKFHLQLGKYLQPLAPVPLIHHSLGLKLETLDIALPHQVIQQLKVNIGAAPVAMIGGTMTAKQRLQEFIQEKLPEYNEKRNHPELDYLSHMSPYLHFGQISPLYIAEQILNAVIAGQESKEAYLEELLVRRELSMNFVFYQENYDGIDCLPAWALATLQQHALDLRPYLYSLSRLENADTHDPYWNAAQKEMVVTGKMHGYMRLYWGKKILEWSRDFQEAYQAALYLNNKYELDGRDANGYTGVAWCFGKHDRPWQERAIFGKVRYMNDKGLERKFDMKRYLVKIKQL